MVMVTGSIVVSRIFFELQSKIAQEWKEILKSLISEKLTFSDGEQKPKEGFCCITMGWVDIVESKKKLLLWSDLHYIRQKFLGELQI